MTKATGLPLILASGALLAGCGGGGGSARTRSASSSAPTPRAASADFVARADAICKQVATKREATNRAVAEAGGSPSRQLRVIARVGPAAVANERHAMEQLHAIEAPSSLAQDWSRLLTGIQALTDDAVQIVIDAQHRNVKAVEALTRNGRQVRRRLTSTAILDGFRYCGRES